MKAAHHDLLERAQEMAREYVETVGDRRVFPSDEDLAALGQLEEPLPSSPSAPRDTLELLHAVGSPATVAHTGGRYFGFVNGGALPVGMAARWLADAWDQNTAHYVMSPIAAKLEEVCEGWLAELLGLPDGSAAGFVTGTTLANFSGLAAGRNHLLRLQGWDVVEKGLYGAPPLRVIVGAGAHAAVHKTLSLLGMGNAHTEVVPVDAQGRLRADAFPELDAPALVALQAGNVNTGAFDPVGQVTERVRAAGGWVHVDGAFGLWAGASPNLRDLYAGVETADSWAVDAHKTLNVPYDCGIVLCRDREALVGAFRATASYFQWSEERDPMNYTPSMSKRARSVELWAVLRSLGREGVAQLVDGLCAHARRFAERLEEEGFSVLNDVVFNQVLVRCSDDALTSETVEVVQRSGELWCGATVWQERPAIRLSVCSWATTADDIDRSVAALVVARESAAAS